MVSTAFVTQLALVVCSITTASLLKIILVLTVLYNVFHIVYRVTLHPLARYPGRFVDKISIWPLISQCYSGNRHLWIFEAHQRYGSVVRIGPNTLDFDTVTAQTAIHRDRNTNVRKSDWYRLEPSFSGDFSVQTVIDKKEHDFRRRVLQPAFSDNALREQERFIDNNVRVLLSKMGEDIQPDGWSVPREFSQWITFWGFDFISDLAFGSCFNLLEDPTHRYLPDMLKWGSHFIYYAGYLPFAPLLRRVLESPLVSYIPHPGTQESHKFFSASERKLEERRAIEEAGGKPGNQVEKGVDEKPRKSVNEEAQRKDIFHYLFQSRDPETGLGFSHAQLMADSALLIAAGSDGVAVTVAAAVFYLLQNPNCMQKLVHEVCSSFSTADDIRGAKLQQLPYLTGIVNEALRLAPSVPSALPRKVLSGGLDVDGLHIPAGTIVGVSAYSVHHNETYFPDSFVFRPERWIGTGEQVSLARRALCTFSAGRFDCVGKNIAVLACKLVLAKLFYTYELRAAGGSLTGGGTLTAGKGRTRHDEYQLVDHLVSYRFGPLVEFKARI